MRDEAPWQAIRAFFRIFVAAPLLAGSVLLAFQPAVIRSFARTGLPDAVRILLASVEIAASILFMLPRTIYIGGFGLIAVLVAAIGLHAALHLGVGSQPLVLVLVAALLGVEYRVRRANRGRAAAGAAKGVAMDSENAGT